MTEVKNALAPAIRVEPASLTFAENPSCAFFMTLPSLSNSSDVPDHHSFN